MTTDVQTDLTTLTVQLLSAFVSNNTVPSENLPELIKSTRAALTDDLTPAETPAPVYEPAVSVRKSLASSDHILSLIDGKPYKTLKRHLAVNGLTPDEYRERYGLPKSYPLVAKSYSEARRSVAQKNGLGRKDPAPAAPANKIDEAASVPPAATDKAEPVKAARAAAKPSTKVGKTSKASDVAKPAADNVAKPSEAAETPPKAASVKPTKPARKPKATAETTKASNAGGTKPKTLKLALKASKEHLGKASEANASPSDT